MNNKNELQMIDGGSNYDIKIKRGDSSIEMSPEMSIEICGKLVELGAQLVSGAGKVTVEAFNTQANMYYAQLNTYLSNQTLKSEERKSILEKIGGYTDRLVDLICNAKSEEEREALMGIKGMLDDEIERQMKFYLNALDRDAADKMPKIPNLARKFKGLFRRNP